MKEDGLLDGKGVEVPPGLVKKHSLLINSTLSLSSLCTATLCHYSPTFGSQDQSLWLFRGI